MKNEFEWLLFMQFWHRPVTAIGNSASKLGREGTDHTILWYFTFSFKLKPSVDLFFKYPPFSGIASCVVTAETARDAYQGKAWLSITTFRDDVLFQNLPNGQYLL